MPINFAAFHSRRTFQPALLASVSALTLFAALTPAQGRNILAGGGGVSPVSNAQAAAMASVQQASAATMQARNSLSRATQVIQAMQAAQSAARNLAVQGPNNLGADPNHPGLQLPDVPNGLGAGGLQVAPGVGSDPTLWQNANLPTQTANNSQTTVTIQQTAQKAILTWQSFNVSKDTTVHFDQSGGTQANGNNDWIALNRIQDPSGRPSQILGQIKAEGSVYLINRNGIIFGGSSQVDVHTLIASSLGFLGESVTSAMVPGSADYDAAVAASNTTFLTAGIAGPEATGVGGLTGNLVLGLASSGSTNIPSPNAYAVPGDITIQAGATITSHNNGPQGNGGFVLVAAPNVSNAGTISAADGQTILAAGIGVSFQPRNAQGGILQPEITGQLVASVNGTGIDVTPVSTLTNTGLVQATRGTVNLIGTNVIQDGVVEVTTGISYPGSIFITAADEAFNDFNNPAYHRAGQAVFGSNSVTANLPEEDGETATSSSTSFKPGSVTVTGGSITFQNGSLLEAPGATVTIGAQVPAVGGGDTVHPGYANGTAIPPFGDTGVPGRVYIDAGATIDVAGLSDVELPMSDILFSIPLIGGNELANTPLQRAGFLKGLKNVMLDSTLSGTTADGLAWVGSPILNAAGYAQLMPRSIDQLLTNGGSLTLAGTEVITASGSSLNLDGGYVHYLGGMVNTTRLVDASGHLVDIGKADPNDVYVGVAGQFTVDHPHWSVTESFGGSLLSGSTYQPDFIVGGNAGTLTVYGKSVVVLDGAMSAQAFAGEKQIAAGQAPSGTAAGGGFLPTGGTFDLGDGGQAAFVNQFTDTNETGSFIIQNQAPRLTDFDPDFNADTPFDTAVLKALDPNNPENVLVWRTIPADAIDAGGFANVKINAGDGHELIVAEGATLNVQPGGSISYKSAQGGAITVLGSLIAPSGTISLESDGINLQSGSGGLPTQSGDITIGPDVVLSTAGLWINDGDLASAPGAATFVNGGTISLSAGLAASVLLETGSVLDVSSGGVLLKGGLQSSNGIPLGKGGNVSLTAENFYPTDANGVVTSDQPITAGGVVMDGTIKSWGFAGGGKLTLQTLGFQIGGDPSTAPAWDMVLPADFFANQGFGSYQLNAVYNATIPDGVTVRLTQQNLIPNLAALASAASGADITQGGLTTHGTLDLYHRQATSLILTAGGYSNFRSAEGNGFINVNYDGFSGAVTFGTGASIIADAGASVGLASTWQVTVLGTIVAPGGSITLSGDTTGYYELPSWQPHNNGRISAFTTASKSVWLGADAVLNVSGTTLTNPFAAPVQVDGRLQTPVTGKVLDGGTVILSDDTGMVVAEAGSVIDVSGASATLDMLQAASSGQAYAPQAIWSNAGSIVLGAGSGLMFDGSIRAHGGAPEAEGGTLTLLPEAPANLSATNPLTTKFPDGSSASTPGATVLILQQSGDLVPAGLQPGQDFAPATGAIQFAADRLDGTGISTLIVGQSSVLSGAVPVPVAFAGDVNLSLGRAVVITAPQIVARPAGATTLPALAAGTTSVGGATISIDAPYVEIAGVTDFNGAPLPPSVVQALGDGVFNVNAAFVDIENQLVFANFGAVNLTSSGDIRLSISDQTASVPGFLYMPGNLTLKAGDLYPASGETFILDAVGPNPTTITFLANGTSSTPLSAGGTLLIDADTIVQSGTIKAPSGAILFGVGDAGDADTKTVFDNLPLIDTRSVSFTAGSTTSVSLGGLTLPYGITTDGTEWTYPSQPNANTTSQLTAPPAKSITVNGADITLGNGATIDLSGGGDLQAMEWVPGTGGSRDVLSQYNISYASSSTGTTVPLYADARNVYAILPGYAAPVAAYDPVIAQQPSLTTQGQTTSLGIGQAGTGDLVGKAVYLSGMPGLPPGVYTLLPAKYATLPGAYRVVQNTGASTVVPGQSTTLADGTNVITGYFADALTGARSATPSQFQVQSGAVWQQYSQYNLTSANSFFPDHVADNAVVPFLPRDAGSLTLAATNNLLLDTTLKAAAGAGGTAGQVDIASQDIQIVGSGEPALAGYLQISALGLDELGAGSLLIGGTRTRTDQGTTIQALANSVVISNDAADPLTGPEIILIAKTDPTGTDANAVNGLQLDSGSVIAAKGDFAAAGDLGLTIEGDGALLMVTNGKLVSVSRSDVPVDPQGLLTVGAGAVLNGGQALVLDSSGNMKFDPSASFSGTAIAVDASTITLTNATAAAALPGFVVGQSGLAQFANSEEVDLRSYSSINFVGDVDLTFGNKVDLSAGSFASDGGAVTLNGPQIAFTNDLGAPVGTAVAGQGSLTVNAGEIDFGAGDKVLNGFATVTMTASSGIVGQGTSAFDLGAANATLAAPAYLADTSADTTLTTTGALTLNVAPGTPMAITPVGGAISFIAGTIADNGATIAAPAGNVSLEATSGDLTIANGATVSSAGVSKQFFDITVFAPAGNIMLTADHGSVNVASGATLDFSGAQGGGAAGSLTLSAPDQVVNLNGTLKGGAITGYLGGSFSLNTGGAVDLDSLAAELASSGVDDAITVQTKAGNLVLSAGNTLTAHVVTLVADGGAGGQDTNSGNVVIRGTIDAAGNAGGEIDLYGKSGVDLEGALIATGSSPTQRGGTVNLGTVGNADTVDGVVQLDPTYGYELVSSANSGAITLGTQAVIDVSGGTAGGLSGGTVNFRAPLLYSSDPAKNGDVNVTIASGAQIKGSRSTTLEAFAVWSTDDPLTYGASKHFDGLVDPAGWFNADGTMVAGAWTNQAGDTLQAPTADQLADYLKNDFFTPDSGKANTDHQTFYGYLNGDATAAASGTLMGFVENFPISAAATNRFAGVANFAVTPGIELDNPDPNVNGGNITVLTSWNLGAGTSATNLAFRFNGQAPVITFKAENDFKAEASLTDGFFQVANPTVVGGSIPVPALSDYDASNTLWTEPSGQYAEAYGIGLSYYNNYFSGMYFGPGKPTGPDPQEIAEYYALYSAYANLLIGPAPRAIYFNSSKPGTDYANIIFGEIVNSGGFTEPGQQAAPVAPSATQQISDAGSYLVYLASYQAYVNTIRTTYSNEFVLVAPPTPPAIQPDKVITGTSVPVPAITDNTPAPVGAADNPLPVLAASLAGGASSSFRIVAGANLASADPTALQPTAAFAASGGGSVLVDGHFTWVDPRGQAVDAPTMIRTGTGAIDIAAANNVSLRDTTAPGVIYTAGTPAPGAPVGTADGIINGDPTFKAFDIFATNTVSPEAAGDLSIHAGNNITSVETIGGTANSGQFWWEWMQIGNAIDGSNRIVQTSINFGGFDQGVMSVGGNVAISAGGNIVDLGVSLPTTWYLSDNTVVNTVGGGNLTVSAGGDILGGDYFVAKGTGTFSVGGKIGASGPISTILATQDGVFDITARQGVDLGAVVDPSYLQGTALVIGYSLHADSQGYSQASTVNVTTTTGDIAFNTISDLTLIGSGTGGFGLNGDGAEFLPATVNLTAFDGGISIERGGLLYPSPTGQLGLIADQSINIYGQSFAGGAPTGFGLVDAPLSSLASPLNPLPTDNSNIQNYFNSNLSSAALIDHSPTPLHADDTQPVRIYSLTGDITDGFLEPPLPGQTTELYDQSLIIGVDKPAQIYAGGNITNLNFIGQNLREDDVTSIIAGKDIQTLDQPIPIGVPTASLELGGPGTFDVEAGRDISIPNEFELTSKNPFAGSPTTLPAIGIVTVGNANNPYLPHESANIEVLFGTGAGVANQAFIAAYVDPTVAMPGVQQALVAFMEQYDAGKGIDTGLLKDKPAISLTLDQAWSEFHVLPAALQQIFNEKALFTVLAQVDIDQNDPTSKFAGQYARGYQAINTLFPASLGYTANSLEGGKNGQATPIHTGNLDIRSNTIQTQQGGNITILGPGGQALVGAADAPPTFLNQNGGIVSGPSDMGILTLEQGDVNIFTDTDVLLAQSRIFTERGGNMVIWSSNGDINAGKGSKSIADIPEPLYVCDGSFFCTRDARGSVTGAGIATLQTIPDAPSGNVYLIAPRGTVDAGDAGIRVSGNLVISALQVLNADNIQVQGTAIGVPKPAAVDIGALSNASNTAGAAASAASAAAKQPARNVGDLPSIITVEVIGYGGGDGTTGQDQRNDQRKKGEEQKSAYDRHSRYQVVALGKITEEQAKQLADEHREEVGR